VAARAPGVVRVSDEIARRLDDPTVLGLNGQVTSQRIPADVVARNWLKQQGLIGQ
jgi:glycine betaine/choline ABC-type transport system substrate-binding protein